MPRKKSRLNAEELADVQVSAEAIAEAEKREPLEVKTESNETKVKRLSFGLKDDGTIDWDAMRSENRDQVTAAIKASVIPGMAEAQKPAFSKETLKFLWHGIGHAEAQFVQTKLCGSIPRPIAKSVFIYSDDEADKLSEALQAVLIKYPALNSLAYKEEIDLAGMVLMLFMVKLQLAMELKKQAMPIKPNGHEVPATPQPESPRAGGSPI
jgi:hypothetical protein